MQLKEAFQLVANEDQLIGAMVEFNKTRYLSLSEVSPVPVIQRVM